MPHPIFLIAFWFPGLFTGTALIFFCLGCLLYFLPSIIAVRRRSDNLVAVLAVNLFAGWTFIGWIVALVLALSTGGDTTYTSYGRSRDREDPMVQQYKLEQLRQLKALLDEGALTRDEFNRQKAVILGV
jgi:hypothetical protein